MKAAFIKAPFKCEVRDIDVRELNDNEVLIRVKACGICGTDMHTAATEARDWQPFGHEVSGTVEKVGSHVYGVRVGDNVVLESGTFCRNCSMCRNGRVDLCNKGPNCSRGESLGFAEYIIAPAECVVPFSGISLIEASLVEPLGVALDLVYTAGLRLNDDVLVVGLGPIGLMALRLAKVMGARNVYGAELSSCTRRIEVAKEFGANDVILTDVQRLDAYDFTGEGIDRVMITAPPRTIPLSMKVTRVGGIVAFLGIQYGEGASISFDANEFHFKKLQLRGSFASPALYFPRCIQLIQSGAVDVNPLISHTFELSEIGEALNTLRDDKTSTVKMVMVNS